MFAIQGSFVFVMKPANSETWVLREDQFALRASSFRIVKTS